MTKTYNEKATFMKDSWYSVCVYLFLLLKVRCEGWEANKRKHASRRVRKSLLKKIGYHCV